MLHPCFPKLISNFDLSGHKIVFYFVSVHSKEVWPKEGGGGVYGLCSYMNSRLHDRALSCISITTAHLEELNMIY